MWIEAIVLVGGGLYVVNYLRERLARRFQLPQAPTFEGMANAVNTELRQASLDGWQQFCTVFPHAPDASLRAANRTRLDIWRTKCDDGRTGWTFVVTQDGKRYPWTLTFIDSDLVIASIGGPNGARFRPDELSDHDLRHLASLHRKVSRHLNIAH